MCQWGGWGLGVVMGLPGPGLTLASAPQPQNFETVALSVFPFPDHKLHHITAFERLSPG